MKIDSRELIKGFINGMGCCFVYENSIDKPFFVYNVRVHHYQVGICILLYGLHRNSSYWIGFGSGLFIHDLEDFKYDSGKFLNKLNKYLEQYLELN